MSGAFRGEFLVRDHPFSLFSLTLCISKSEKCAAIVNSIGYISFGIFKFFLLGVKVSSWDEYTSLTSLIFVLLIFPDFCSFLCITMFVVSMLYLHAFWSSLWSRDQDRVWPLMIHLDMISAGCTDTCMKLILMLYSVVKLLFCIDSLEIEYIYNSSFLACTCVWNSEFNFWSFFKKSNVLHHLRKFIIMNLFVV